MSLKRWIQCAAMILFIGCVSLAIADEWGPNARHDRGFQGMNLVCSAMNLAWFLAVTFIPRDRFQK